MKRQKRRQRVNPALIIVLILLVLSVVYFERFVVATLPSVSISATATPTANPEQVLTQARENFADGNLIRAIELYQSAVILLPNESNVHVELARAQILAGRYREAETSAQNALLLNPDNADAYAYLGWTYIYLDDFGAAQTALNQALALDPENAKALAFLAELAADQEDYEGAGDLSRQAVELDPNSLEVRRARAFVLEVTGNYDEAVIAYQAALSLNDRIADLHMGLGRTYWALGNLDDAVDQFNLADALNPSDPQPDALISRIYLNTGEFPKAIQFASKAVDDDPTNPVRYGNLGVAFYRNLQYADAVEAFGYAVHGGVTPNNQIVTGLMLDYDVAEYYYLYALALARGNQCTEALPVAQGLIASVPADEVAVANAQEVIRLCEAAAQETPTLEPTLVLEGTPVEDTPEPATTTAP